MDIYVPILVIYDIRAIINILVSIKRNFNTESYCAATRFQFN
jgi:hypothetical protein